MAPLTGKRKRVEVIDPKAAKRQSIVKDTRKPTTKTEAIHQDDTTRITTQKQVKYDANATLTIQIVTGDYERVTHGLAASIPSVAFRDQLAQVETTFTETFLFTAHTASVRCLAVSPKAENDKRFLATGSADERINVYSISTAPPRPSTSKAAPTLNGAVIAENSSNRSLGSLNHHDRAVSRLTFPTKGKLFSAAEDNTVAISRTRDWTMLSSIKAPIPNVQGRPSGDTAAPGEVPTGVNDFAIHPSQKLMLSVCRGERCMRLWNLMTGKKAGVLNFDRELLVQVGEGKHSSGEGRRVVWDDAGEHYVVGFERGAVLFGIDSKPLAVVRPQPVTKLHHYAIVPAQGSVGSDTLAISTEDGRILFYHIGEEHRSANEGPLSKLQCIAQLGGKSAGVSSRVKDFTILPVPSINTQAPAWVVVTAGSDGTLSLWSVDGADLSSRSAKSEVPKQIGRLVAAHKMQSRITCLAAFVMDGKQEAASHTDNKNLEAAAAASEVEEDSD